MITDNSKGTILKGIGGFYYVKDPANDIYECTPRGLFRKKDITPLPGDEVLFSITDALEYKGSLVDILPRRTCIVRPAVANVDVMVIVIAARSPDPDLILVDKMIASCFANKLGVMILINKTDLDLDKEYIKIEESYRRSRFDTICMNEFEKDGLEKLKGHLSGHTSVLAGQSGAGKSTILNAITKSYSMETGSVSEKIKKGRHTTRHAQLFELENGGYIVDTPGFSLFELSNIKANELKSFYPEFEDEAGSCRFRGCIHVNEPDCYVKNKVREGFICRDRYERYVSIYKELEKIKEY